MMDYLSLILFYINFYSFTFLIPQSLASLLSPPFTPFSLISLFLFGLFHSSLPKSVFELQILNHHLPYLPRFSVLIHFDLQTFTHLWPK